MRMLCFYFFKLHILEQQSKPPTTAESYLPGGETGGAHQVTAGLDLHVLVVLGADLAQLESGAHLAVQLVLLLGRLGGGGGAVRKQRGPTAWTTPRDHTARWPAGI